MAAASCSAVMGPLFNGVNRSSCIPASIAKPASTANHNWVMVSGLDFAFAMADLRVPDSTTLGHRLSTKFISPCCSKAIMSGVNGNVIMSGWGNGHHPDNATTKANRDHRASFKKRTNGDRGSDGIGG